MTCDVEHTMVESRALLNPPNPLQILGSSAGFRNQFSSENTYLCKLDLKRLKPAPGSGVVTANSKPRAAQITKSLFSQEKSYWLLPRKIF